MAKLNQAIATTAAAAVTVEEEAMCVCVHSYAPHPDCWLAFGYSIVYFCACLLVCFLACLLDGLDGWLAGLCICLCVPCAHQIPKMKMLFN